jgi:hypothetical protein
VFVVICRPAESHRNSFTASPFYSTEADFPKEQSDEPTVQAGNIYSRSDSVFDRRDRGARDKHLYHSRNSVTDTRSLQNDQYTNDKTVTAPNGQTYTNDKTVSRNGSGQVVSQDTQTGPNGRSATATDTRSLQSGQYTNDKTVTGPNGKTYTNDKTTRWTFGFFVFGVPRPS